MLTPGEIKLKAERQYPVYLQTWVRGEPFTPLAFPAGKASANFGSLRTEVQALQTAEKTALKPGYRIEWQVQQKRALNTQTLPSRIWLDTAEDFLHLIGKSDEFELFMQDVMLMRARIPQLENWVRRSPRKVIEYHNSWPGLLAVCRYLQTNPRPGLYIRELPVNVHTKFIEQHQGILRELLEQLLPAETITPDAATFQQRFGLREEDLLVHLRFLDDQLRQCYGIPLDECAIPLSQLARMEFRGQTCVITENKMTFLTLPPLPQTLAILGGGFKVSSLAALSWLHDCPIIYWGDLDAQGFQILSQMRSTFSHVTSLMMDETTFNTFSEWSVAGTPCRVRQLPYLTSEEHALFVQLAENERRLEQERISYTYALQQLRACQIQSP